MRFSLMLVIVSKKDIYLYSSVRYFGNLIFWKIKWKTVAAIQLMRMMILATSLLSITLITPDMLSNDGMENLEFDVVLKKSGHAGGDVITKKISVFFWHNTYLDPYTITFYFINRSLHYIFIFH